MVLLRSLQVGCAGRHWRNTLAAAASTVLAGLAVAGAGCGDGEDLTEADLQAARGEGRSEGFSAGARYALGDRAWQSGSVYAVTVRSGSKGRRIVSQKKLTPGVAYECSSAASDCVARAPSTDGGGSGGGEDRGGCAAEYPDTCIPPPPPDLNCDEIDERGFKVRPPDRHGFDRDENGLGCESE